MGYSKVNIDELEPAGPGGGVRFIRRELGLEAFGLNWFELPPNAAVSPTTSKTLGRRRST